MLFVARIHSRFSGRRVPAAVRENTKRTAVLHICKPAALRARSLLAMLVPETVSGSQMWEVAVSGRDGHSATTRQREREGKVRVGHDVRYRNNLLIVKSIIYTEQGKPRTEFNPFVQQLVYAVVLSIPN